MSHPHPRIQSICKALRHAHLDALVCAFPSDVLLLTGYWPVIGTAVAVASVEGGVVVIAPEDEEELARRGWAEVRTFAPTALDKLRRASEALVEPLGDVLRHLEVNQGVIGHDGGPISLTAPYSAVHIYGRAISTALRQAAPSATFFNAMQMVTRLREIKTSEEIARIRSACTVAAKGFAAGRSETLVGLREVEAASIFRGPLSTYLSADDGRADGFMYCMSGPNAAQAQGAYARSRGRCIQRGDLVLMHCNSYVDGYWTDITRTYCIGPPDTTQRKLYAAVFAARDAALKAVRPGVKGSAVDAAARSVLEKHGYGKQFKHSTGHGVGFGAIDPNALPRLHPKSPDVLEAGMVFNIEPAIYIEGYGGVRHCDMVALLDSGAELLTDFDATPQRLTIRQDVAA